MHASPTLLFVALLVPALTAARVDSLAAQETTVASRAASIRIGGRIQGQYQASSVALADNDFFLRRVRVIADIAVNDFVSGRVQTEFAGGGNVQDAYVRLAFDDDLHLYVGQFKRAFDIFELASSTDLSVIERDGRVGGYDLCTGVGSVCSFSRLTEALDFAGRDVGVRVEGTAGPLGIMASVTNGPGANSRDEDDAKSGSVRASYPATDKVTVAGGIAVHDYLEPGGEAAYALAWSGDVQIGTWRDGFMLQAALVAGDNWRSLDVAGDPGTFTTFQVIATHYVPVAWERIVGIEPLGRVSIADPDGDAARDGGTLLTPGLSAYFLGRNKLSANLDYYVPDTGDSELSFKVQMFLYF